MVTGLTVNSKVAVPKKIRRLIRAMVHAQTATAQLDYDMIEFLKGHAAFMKKAHPAQAEQILKTLKSLC